jgi:hypothetical protein
VDSPAINLLTAVVGFAGAVLLLGTLLAPLWPSRQRWIAAVAVVAVVVLGVGLPGKLRSGLDGLDAQHDAYAASYEQLAHERCLRDMGRDDLPAALAFARAQIPEGARYYARTRSQSVGCLMLNLFPLEPVRSEDFDPARDWIVLDDLSPSKLATPELREHARRTDLRVTDTASPTFVLVRPEEPAG